MSETSDLSIIFYGKDADECEEFIRLVRLHAFKKGKDNDNPWIARQVYPCFGGKALRWYLKQAQDIRGDWELLQQALIEKWPEVEDERSVQPTPAAAPPSTGNVLQQLANIKVSNTIVPRIGRISVTVSSNPRISGYLSKKLTASHLSTVFPGTFPVTTDVAESLEVKLLRTETPDIWRLGVEDLPGVEYLAAYPPGGSDFKRYCGAIIGVQQAPTGRSGESTTYASTNSVYINHQYHTDVWKLGNRDSLTFRWPALGDAEVPIVVYDSIYLGILDESLINYSTFRKAELAFIQSSS